MMGPTLASAASLDIEEAPAIVEAKARSSRLPRGQLAILALMRLSEPCVAPAAAISLTV